MHTAERIPPTVEQDWYFTFGVGDEENGGTYVVIRGTSKSSRAEMLRRFGRKWAFQYDAVDWNVGGVSQAEKYGLVENDASRAA